MVNSFNHSLMRSIIATQARINLRSNAILSI